MVVSNSIQRKASHTTVSAIQNGILAGNIVKLGAALVICFHVFSLSGSLA